MRSISHATQSGCRRLLAGLALMLMAPLAALVAEPSRPRRGQSPIDGVHGRGVPVP